MKTKIISGIIFISIVFLSSCGGWINPGLNTDPTGPMDASLNAILPTAQSGIAYVVGGDIGRFVSLFTQHHTGIDRQHLGLYNYVISESDIDNAWNTMYYGPMEDLYIMINKSQINGSPHYQGIAEILMAFSLGTWTDILGDIPYSESFQGADNFTPVYDSQQKIYNSIQTLLDSAIIHLAAAKSNYNPGADDFMYGGDLALWTKAAYNLKARYLLHLKKYSEALTALTNSFADNSEDLQFNFTQKESEANPWYQFMTQRGDISMGGFLMTMMNTLSDPRRSAYAEKDDAGGYSENSTLGAFYASINSPVPFSTYVEGKFIEAEAQFQGGNKAAAYTAYISAITASLEKVGVNAADVATYLANPLVGVGEANITLKAIMEQKYIALYTQPEGWSDWRRTSFPALTPTSGNQIPRRMPYPQSERLFNGDNLRAVPDYNPSNTFIFTKMWWDKTYW